MIHLFVTHKPTLNPWNAKEYVIFTAAPRRHRHLRMTVLSYNNQRFTDTLLIVSLKGSSFDF